MSEFLFGLKTPQVIPEKVFDSYKLENLHIDHNGIAEMVFVLYNSQTGECSDFKKVLNTQASDMQSVVDALQKYLDTGSSI